MTRDQMLENLREHGEDAGSDYNDVLDGWFGWTVADDVLIVTWKSDGEDTARDAVATASWRLVPMVESPRRRRQERKR